MEVPEANGTLSEQEAGALRTPTKAAPVQMTINVDVTFKIRVLELMVRFLVRVLLSNFFSHPQILYVHEIFS